MTITVCIPCRNEAPFIEECVRALYACDLPEEAKLNVFVVDGMSDDETRAIVTNLIEEYSTLHLVDNEMQLTPYAFNKGIEAGGKTDYIQIVGARHILSKNYLQNCLEKLKEEDQTYCVGGRIENEYLNSIGEIIAKAMGTRTGMGTGNFRTLRESGYTDTVTSPMYPYKVIEEFGWFDERLVRNQDDEYNFRLTKAGKKIFFDAEISLKYYVRGNFKGLWRQFFQYGYWKVFVNKKHKSVSTMRQLVSPFFVAYLLTFPWAFFFGPIIGLIAAVPFVFYLILVKITSLVNASSISSFFQLTLTYWILHLSYGLGYLKGILDFMILKKKPSDKQARLSR